MNPLAQQTIAAALALSLCLPGLAGGTKKKDAEKKPAKIITSNPFAKHKHKLEVGDILLYMDKGYWAGVAAGQGISRLNPVIAYRTHKGSIYTHHAAVFMEKPDKRPNRADGAVRPGVIHSTGTEGVTFSAMDDDNGFKRTDSVYRSYLIYRLKDPDVRKKWAAKVLEVAEKWTPEIASQRAAYADFTKLLSPAFHSSSYGKHAQGRVDEFVKAAKNGLSASDKFFCSQLVIALYQAALGKKEAAKLMALDADYTSPMKLHHYLAENESWKFVGEEYIIESLDKKAEETKKKDEPKQLSFDELLDGFQKLTDKKTIAAIMAAAKKTFGDDQLNFLVSVRDYKASPSMRGALAEKMVAYYLDPKKDSALNISASLRKELVAEVEKWQKAAVQARKKKDKSFDYPAGLWDGAAKEVRRMIIGQGGADHKHLWEALRKLFAK